MVNRKDETLRDDRAPLTYWTLGVIATLGVVLSAVMVKEGRVPALARMADQAEPIAEPTTDDLIDAVTTLVQASPEPVEHGPIIVADEEIRWFNGRAMRPARTVTMRVTAYSPHAASCGEYADGLTATLHPVSTNRGKLVAADQSMFPYGTPLSIPGYDDGQIVPVLDCGGAIKGNRLDVLFPTHEAALEWGVRELEVVVWKPVDGQPIDNPRKLR